MAIANTLNDFVIRGIEDLMFYDADGKYKGRLKYLSDINISDTTSVAELRGGYGNPVLLTIRGDRTVQMTANNSTLSMTQLSIMLNSTKTVKTVASPKYELRLPITSNTVTLTGTPMAGQDVSVFTTNTNGEDLIALTKVVSAPTGNQFSITGNTITVSATVTGSLNVYYFVSQEVESIAGTGGATDIYKCYAKCVLQSISNKRMYSGDIVMPNVQVSSDVNLGGSNSAEVPEASVITLDLLSLNNEVPYTINAYERA